MVRETGNEGAVMGALSNDMLSFKPRAPTGELASEVVLDVRSTHLSPP